MGGLSSSTVSIHPNMGIRDLMTWCVGRTVHKPEPGNILLFFLVSRKLQLPSVKDGGIYFATIDY